MTSAQHKNGSWENMTAGTVIAGRFKVIRRLGSGGCAEVFLAGEVNNPSSHYALKVMRPLLAGKKDAVFKFDKEISLSSRVHHENVVRTLHTIITYEYLACTMEYVPGGSLADLMSFSNPLPMADCVSILNGICKGLSAIHKAGIVHNDLKTSNILLTTELKPKISDFGIARDIHSSPASGPRFATVATVSPEFARHGRADFRSDIFSLGVLAYQMVTGRSPFKGKNPQETIALRFTSRPVAPHILRPECPMALSRMILKAMSLEPNERFQSVNNWSDGLKEYVGAGIQ